MIIRLYSLLLSGTSVIHWQTSTARALGPYGWTQWRVSVMRRHWRVVDTMDGVCTTVRTAKMYQLPALVRVSVIFPLVYCIDIGVAREGSGCRCTPQTRNKF